MTFINAQTCVAVDAWRRIIANRRGRLNASSGPVPQIESDRIQKTEAIGVEQSNKGKRSLVN